MGLFGLKWSCRKTELVQPKPFLASPKKGGQGKEMLSGMVAGQRIIPVAYCGCHIIRPKNALTKVSNLVICIVNLWLGHAEALC